jgi:hypothetical protein
MQPTEPRRPDGWYWVRRTASSGWQPDCFSADDQCWTCQRGEPFEVGPRIPFPSVLRTGQLDEQPAPRDAAPACPVTAQRVSEMFLIIPIDMVSVRTDLMMLHHWLEAREAR